MSQATIDAIIGGVVSILLGLATLYLKRGQNAHTSAIVSLTKRLNGHVIDINRHSAPLPKDTLFGKSITTDGPIPTESTPAISTPAETAPDAITNVPEPGNT